MRPSSTSSRRAARRFALPALLALLAPAVLGGCRTTAARAPASPEASTGPADAAVAPYALESRSRLVVMASGHTFLLLGAGPVQLGDRAAWSVTYAAAPDPSAGLAPDARGRLTASADELFGAFRILAEAAHLDLVSVTAVFGAPGQRGLGQQIAYLRRPEGWGRSAPLAAAIAQVPPLPARVDRALAEERGAMAAARRFLDDVARGDYDAAWSLSSAVVKATTSRADFARQLDALLDHPGGPAERRELYRSFPAGEPVRVPGAEMEVWFASSTSAGEALETVRVRLDDDLEWRVAGVQELAPRSEGQAATAALLRR